MISRISGLNSAEGIKALSFGKKKSGKLERVPEKDTLTVSSTKIELSDKVKKMLDTTEFNIEKENGDVFQGTVRDYLKSCKIRENSLKHGISLVHCTQTKESRKMILKNGLDWTKTGRMKCGPGTYFTRSAAGGMMQGGGFVPINAKYIGKMKSYPVFESCFYTGLTKNQEIRDKISEIDSGNPGKILDKYCHDILLDEMGIDFLYAASGRGVGSYVVFNDSCMSLSKGE